MDSGIDDVMAGVYGELMDATMDPGSRLLGMYYAAWQREMNIPAENVVLVRLESRDGKLNMYYFTDAESAGMDMQRQMGGGGFADI